MIGTIIGPIANLAGTFLQGRLEKAKANTEVKVATAKAKAKIMERQATGEIDWDLESLKGAILFSVPLALAFVPGMELHVLNGFTVLEQMPEWYQYSLGVIVASSFGVRAATKFFRRK